MKIETTIGLTEEHPELRIEELIDELVSTVDMEKLPKKVLRRFQDINDIALEVIHDYMQDELEPEDEMLDEFMELFPHANREQCREVILAYVNQYKKDGSSI